MRMISTSTLSLYNVVELGVGDKGFDTELIPILLLICSLAEENKCFLFSYFFPFDCNSLNTTKHGKLYIDLSQSIIFLYVWI
jgi:hypothetical protein